MSDEDLEIVKILARLTIHPNAPPPGGDMEGLQFIGQQEMGIQKLSKYWPLLTDNPNAPNQY